MAMDLEAWLELERRVWSDFARAAAPGMVAADLDETGRGGLLLIASRQTAVPVFNRIMGIVEHDARAIDAIARASAWYHGCGFESYWLQLGTGSVPSDFERRLSREQFTREYDSAVVVHRREITAPLSSRIDVRRIGADHREVFGRVVSEAYQWPPGTEALTSSVVGRDGWYHYLAYDDARPIGCGATFCSDGLAWLGFGGVVRSDRGRGCQTALIARRLADAPPDCRLVMSDPMHGSSSFRNFLRLGFEHAASRPVYRFARRGPLAHARRMIARLRRRGARDEIVAGHQRAL